MGKLNEHLNRIKGMMKMIQESDYNVLDQLPNKDPDQNMWELNSIVNYVMADFSESPYFEDYDIHSDGGYFAITDEAGTYELRYEFDLEIISAGYFIPGTYDDPPESEGAEYNYENIKLTITDIADDNENVLYSGDDFTKFESMKFAGSKSKFPVTGWDIMYKYFDDKINEIADR